MSMIIDNVNLGKNFMDFMDSIHKLKSYADIATLTL